jgi:CRP/FNR family cyclic AMP-dependent transcriptional regulator
VRALERSAISVVPREQALAFIMDNPAWSLDLIFELAHRARLATDNFKSLALFDVYGRIARLLLSLAEASNGAQVIRAMPTQSEIGQRVGASREMVGIILRDLESGGYITRNGRSATIAKTLPKRW